MVMMRPLSEMREQMERFFHDMEDFQFPPALIESRGERDMRTWRPFTDLSEINGNYELKMEVPGIKPENLDIQVLEDAVVVRGQTRDEQVEEKKDVYRRECHYGSVYRRIPLPGAIKAENAKADLKDGVLKLVLPKAESKGAKRIPVQAK